MTATPELEEVKRETEADAWVSGGTARVILSALGDDFSDRILACANEQARTVEQISELEGIPLSTCYRRIRDLLDAGLLMIERIVITNSGRRYAIYRSSYKTFQVLFDVHGTRVHALLNDDVADKVRNRQMMITYSDNGTALSR